MPALVCSTGRRLAVQLAVCLALAGWIAVAASADTPQDLEVSTVCNAQEIVEPYNFNLCVDTTGIPWSRSSAIVGAQWSSEQTAPALSGDHAQTTWGTDGNAYVALDDGLSGIATGHVIVKATGSPPSLTWSLVHSNTPVGTYPGLSANAGYYMEGFTSVHGVMYATRMPFQWGLPLNNAPYFANTLYPYGLDGIAYSTDNGSTWTLPPMDSNGYTLSSARFGPDLDASGNVIKAPANLNFVQFAEDGGTAGSTTGNVNPNDGWIYAIFQDRERNADNIYLGAVYPDSAADVVDPTKWEWYKGGGLWTTAGSSYSSSIHQAQPLLTWSGTQTLDDSGGHFGYPELHYDRAIGRYLLTFDYSYNTRASCDPAPPSDCSTYDRAAAGYANDGGELVILDASSITGPYTFVARAKYFGPGNGYSIGIPPVWQGPLVGSHQDVWLKWAADYANCTSRVQAKVDCQYYGDLGYYAYDMRRIRLTLAGGSGTLSNAGFESGSLDPWIASSNGAIASGQARTGTYAAQVTGAGSWVGQTVSGLTPNTSYTLTGYGKVSGDGSVRVGAYEYDGSAETDSAAITSSTYSSGTVTFTPTGQSATVYCWRDAGTTGSAYCDDLSLTPTSGSGVTVANPGFETGDASSWLAGDGGTITAVTGQAHTGSYALDMVGAWVDAEQTITGLTPGHTYTLHGWMKVSSGGSGKIGVYQYNGSTVSYGTATTSTSYGEQTVSFAPTGTTATIFCYHDTSDASVHTYCDDFSVTG